MAMREPYRRACLSIVARFLVAAQKDSNVSSAPSISSGEFTPKPSRLTQVNAWKGIQHESMDGLAASRESSY